MTPPIDSPWLTLREGATYARRGPRPIRKAVKDGHLRAARIGGKGQLFFRREWLDDWIEGQAVPVMVPGRRRA